MKITSEQTIKKAEVTTSHAFYELEYIFSGGEVQRVSGSIYSLLNGIKKGDFLGSVSIENSYLSCTIPVANDMHKYVEDLEVSLIKIREDASNSHKSPKE